MFIQFSFKNFKSFKDESILDMTASSIREHPYNLIGNSSNQKYIKVAAIYGANASGKSNVLEAFKFMSSYAINSLKYGEDDEKLERELVLPRFLFNDSSKNQQSEFEVIFSVGNIEYQYGFILDNRKIYYEWLYSNRINSKKKDKLFERSNNKVEFGEKMANAEIFKGSVEDRTLFLSLTAKTKIGVSKKILQWFRETYVINFGDIQFESLASRRVSPEIIINETYKNKLQEFLVAIDSGIKGIKVEVVESTGNSKEKKCKLLSIHEMEETEKKMETSFLIESSGTQKMLLLFDFFWAAMQSGSLLFIDELNAKLHPLLVRYIINMFHDPLSNKNNAQLIYTTHDIFTLSKETFRRDEIWFTEKSSKGVSKLYSLVEYKLDDTDGKVRNDALFFKEYMNGRYGAIPLLKEFDMLGES